MKYLVTGGAGFIGKYLVKELLETGHQIVVLDNLSNSKNLTLPLKVEFIDGDIRNIDDVKKASKGVDLVYHLAAKISTSESIEKRSLYYAVNIKGTQNIFEVNKNKKIVFISSAAVYGDTLELPIKETQRLIPKSPYSETKISCEKIISQNPENCIVRLFNVYGLGQSKEYASVLTKFFSAINEKRSLLVFGEGNQTRDFVHISDVVSALLFLQNERGVFNIGTGKEISVNKLLQIIGSYKNIEVRYAAKRDGDIRRSVADISKIMSRGWKPRISLGEGIKDMLSEI